MTVLILSPLYKADCCFDRIPIHYKDTLMYVDPITRQTYDYATPILCDNNPRNIIELDADTDDQDFCILRPEPIKRKPPLMFTPNQIKTLQYAQIHLQLNTLVYIQMQNSINFGTEFSIQNILIQHFNYFNDKLLNLFPLFTPSWFADAFITLFAYRVTCYILTQCGI